MYNLGITVTKEIDYCQINQLLVCSQIPVLSLF